MATWSGKLTDANGRVGTVEIQTPDQPNETQGEWRLRLTGRDQVELEMKGPITIEGELGQGDVRISATEEQSKGTVTWELQLAPAGAGQYAKQAVVGQYQVKGATEGLPVSQGVVVLWLFE